MPRTYHSELAELRQTIDWVSAVDITELSLAAHQGRSSPLVAVGSGGSFSAASHLARLHRSFFGQVSAACTPYRLISEPIAAGASHWIFSAGGSNFDAVAAVHACQQSEAAAVNVVTMQANSQVASLCRQNSFLNLHVLDPPSGKDGFLATNSLLAFSALLSRCYLSLIGAEDEWDNISDVLRLLSDPKSEQVLKWREECARISSVEHLVVLYGDGTNLGGVDLESKLIESALTGVQLADYRHFAHGRHHWLAKNADTTGVLAFVSNLDHELSTSTLKLIPEPIPRAQLDVEGSRESAELGSLLAAFHATAAIGSTNGVDPAQPEIPEFGRKIHLLEVSDQITARPAYSTTPRVGSKGRWR